MKNNRMKNNPIIWSDFPDPDVIRVENTYYMVTTTMHMMPGCAILRSYDLIHWEHASYVFERLEETKAQALEGTEQIYGKGMWAASLRFYNGVFYVCFVANDTGKTYLFTSNQVEGPWSRQTIEGFYHDNSLLFDEDGCVYIVYGNTDIYITQLEEDLTAPKKGGLHRVIIRDEEPFFLGYEGAHIYKIDGRYYVFLIHISKRGYQRRTQACFWSDTLDAMFTGMEVLDDDMGYFNAGVAQGGIVDTKNGDWYSILFQDHGAVGRVPVVVPMKWENRVPVLGNDKKVEFKINVESMKPEYLYKPLVGSDDFGYQVDQAGKVHLNDVWQWNHLPDDDLWTVTKQKGVYQITTGKISENIHYAVNTLTQRTFGPACQAQVTVDGSALKEGDYAGLCLLIGTYGFIAITKREGELELSVIVNEAQDDDLFEKMITLEPGREIAKTQLHTALVRVKAVCDFVNNRDEVTFYYLQDGEWIKLGSTHRMFYKLDHFMGARFGLFHYATKEIGGSSGFSQFEYEILQMNNPFVLKDTVL